MDTEKDIYLVNDEIRDFLKNGISKALVKVP